MIRTFLFALLFLFTPFLFFSLEQTRAIQGWVKSEDGLPITGASVRFQGQLTCTRTDAAGHFQLTARPGPITANKAGYRIGSIIPRITPARIKLSPLPTEDNEDYAWTLPGPNGDKPNQCANCHQAIYSEWNNSGHARSANNRKFLALLYGTDGKSTPRLDWNLKHQHPAGVGVCVNCHAPTFQDPTLEYDFRSLNDVAGQGVHCDYCHKIADAPVDKLGTRFGRDGYPLLRPKEGDSFSFGPLEDAIRTGESFIHAPFYKESRYCASCHEGVLFGVHVYGTYSEWLKSPARNEGRQCQNCHMAPTGSLTNIAPGHGGIERDPKTLASHVFPGGTMDMLRKSLKLHVKRERGPEAIKVTVELLAENVGHRVPTGFIDRHLVLVVEAWNAYGKPVAALTGPKFDSAAGPKFAGLAGRLYAKKLSDGERSPIPFWVPTDSMTDTRLFPNQPDRQEFIFPAATVLVHTRVLYRRFWQQIADPLHWLDNEILVVERKDW